MQVRLIFNQVREHIPLEQGLRLTNRFLSVAILNVREHIPLEQGLRQYILLSVLKQ